MSVSYTQKDLVPVVRLADLEDEEGFIECSTGNLYVRICAEEEPREGLCRCLRLKPLNTDRSLPSLSLRALVRAVNINIEWELA